MRLTKHDLNVRLSDEDTEPAGTRLTPRDEDSIYKQIVHHPDRAVTVDAAYKRIRRHPNMSVDEACTKPSQQAKKRIGRIDSTKPLVGQVPDGYIDNLRGTRANNHIARVWNVNQLTVARHRKLLRGQDAERSLS